MAIQVQLIKRYLRSRKRNGQREYRWTMRWEDPVTGRRPCESTGTADRTQAEALQKVKWAELNIPGVAEPEPAPAVALPDWQDCRDAIERAAIADNLRQRSIDDYLMTFECLRRMFPEVASPGEITAAMANEFKRRRAEQQLSPATILGDLRTLRSIYSKWLIKECGLLSENPFAGVKPPRCDAPTKRIILPSERQALFDWLGTQWNNWRLPVVYLEVKAWVAWRATELASMREEDILPGGYVQVMAESSKTRTEKCAWLPPDLHAELKTCVAGGYAFGKFADELRRLLLLWKKRPHHAQLVKDFAPSRLVGWLQDELSRFHAEQQATEDAAAAEQERQPQKPDPFTLHDFRRTGITEYQMAGASEKDMSIQAGCTPEVMRKHYEKLNGFAIAKRNSEKRLAWQASTIPHPDRRASDAQGS